MHLSVLVDPTLASSWQLLLLRLYAAKEVVLTASVAVSLPSPSASLVQSDNTLDSVDNNQTFTWVAQPTTVKD